MSRFDMTILSTEEILSGLKELRTGMKKDEYLDKEFSAILEDSERRIRSCEWRDYTKERPKENIKVIFKVPDSKFNSRWVGDFYEEDALIKKHCKEDDYTYKEGELLWKPFETESKISFDLVWRKMLILEKGFNEDEYMRNRYSNLITNIMERVNSGEWRNLRGYRPVERMPVIYKASYLGRGDNDYDRYGVSMYYPDCNKIMGIRDKNLFHTIKWKPLEIENVI